MSLPNTPAPIVLFVFKRLEPLIKVVSTLQENYLASESILYIFSDGAKTTSDDSAVKNVRRYIRNITGFKNIIIFESVENLGLAASVIRGVTSVLSIHRIAIVLEDDLITSPNFLDFINQGLRFYEKDQTVFSICGYSFPMKGLDNKDVFFTNRSSSWGWGTWEDRWRNVDWEVKDYESFRRDHKRMRQFKKSGEDAVRLLKKQKLGQIDSWAIRFTYSQFVHGSLSVFPTISKIVNIGFNDNLATHTSGDNPHLNATNFDSSGKREFSFPKSTFLDQKTQREFIKPNSNWNKIKMRVLSALLKHMKK